MKKIIFLAAATMLWGCGPGEEMQDTQEQLAQQESALNYSTDPIIGKWYWTAGPDYRVDVRVNGDGLQMTTGCFNGALAWRYITYSRTTADGTKIYTGQVGTRAENTYCTWVNWSDVTFRAAPDWNNLRIVYNSTYSETYVKFY